LQQDGRQVTINYVGNSAKGTLIQF